AATSASTTRSRAAYRAPTSRRRRPRGRPGARVATTDVALTNAFLELEERPTGTLPFDTVVATVRNTMQTIHEERLKESCHQREGRLDHDVSHVYGQVRSRE